MYILLPQILICSIQSHFFEELSPFVVRGCKDRRDSVPAKSFLKLSYPCNLKHKPVLRLNENIFFKESMADAAKRSSSQLSIIYLRCFEQYFELF